MVATAHHLHLAPLDTVALPDIVQEPVKVATGLLGHQLAERVPDNLRLSIPEEPLGRRIPLVIRPSGALPMIASPDDITRPRYRASLISSIW